MHKNVNNSFPKGSPTVKGENITFEGPWVLMPTKRYSRGECQLHGNIIIMASSSSKAVEVHFSVFV